jgi:hypothetical protein
MGGVCSPTLVVSTPRCGSSTRCLDQSAAATVDVAEQRALHSEEGTVNSTRCSKSLSRRRCRIERATSRVTVPGCRAAASPRGGRARPVGASTASCSVRSQHDAAPALTFRHCEQRRVAIGNGRRASTAVPAHRVPGEQQGPRLRMGVAVLRPAHGPPIVRGQLFTSAACGTLMPPSRCARAAVIVTASED